MSLRSLVIASLLGLLPALVSGCSGAAPGDVIDGEPGADGGLAGDSPEGDVGQAREAVTSTAVPFLNGTATGMTFGNGAFVDLPNDGLLGWARADDGHVLQLRNVNGGTATATATLSWGDYVAPFTGTYQILPPEVVLTAGSMAISSQFVAQSFASAVLQEETIVNGSVKRRVSHPLARVPTNVLSTPFTTFTTPTTPSPVYAAAGQRIQYRLKLALVASSPAVRGARVSIDMFGVPTNSGVNTNTPIRIQIPAVTGQPGDT